MSKKVIMSQVSNDHTKYMSRAVVNANLVRDSGCSDVRGEFKPTKDGYFVWHAVDKGEANLVSTACQ
jgi:hypothetical protein